MDSGLDERCAVDAKSGQGEAAEAFTMLGLTNTDAAGRMPEPLEFLHDLARERMGGGN